MNQTKNLSIIIMPIHSEIGMAGSIRIRNLYSPILNSNIKVKNIIFTEEITKKSNTERLYLIYSKHNVIRMTNFLLLGCKALKKSFDSKCINVLYIYGGIDIHNFIFLLYAKSLGYKIIVDIIEEFSYQKVKSTSRLANLKTKSKSFFEKYFCKLIDTYIAISKNLEISIEHKIKKMRCNAISKIVLIPVTVDFNEFPITNNQKVLSSKEINLFYGGSFGLKDGLKYYLAAIKMLISSGVKVKLTVTGEGTKAQENDFFQLVETYGLKNNVIFLGNIERSQYLNLLLDTDIHCMTRIDDPFSTAGFPFKLAEMLATGKPVIASKLNNITSVLSENELFFVNPEQPREIFEAIISLIKNPTFAKELGNNGRIACKSHFDCRKYNISIAFEKLFSLAPITQVHNSY